MTLALALIAPALAQDAPALPEAPEAPEAPQAPAIPEAPTPRLKPFVDADQRVVIEEPASDLFLMGQDVSLRGGVGDNAFVLAQSLDVTSPVAGDLFAMGEDLVIADVITGDVYAMGETVRIKPGARVLGSLTIAAGELIIEGPIAGDVSGQVGRVVLAAPIAGDVQLQAGEIAVESGAAIGGDLDYVAGARAADLEAVVGGDIDFEEGHDEIEIEIEAPVEEESGSMLGSIVWWGTMRGWGFLTKLLVGCVLLLIGGERMAAVGRRVVSHPGQSLGVGFITLCVLPVASTLALLTVVPFPLGLLGFAALGGLLYVSQIFAAQALGDALLRLIQPDAIGSPYLSLAIGLVPLIALCSLPWLGTFAWMGATIVGTGALWSVIRSEA